MKEKAVELTRFNGQNISTGQVVNYICKLHEEIGFRRLGYNYEKDRRGVVMFIICTYPEPSKSMVTYFNRKCHCIEDEVKKIPKLRKLPKGCRTELTSLGFVEVLFDE